MVFLVIALTKDSHVKNAVGEVVKVLMDFLVGMNILKKKIVVNFHLLMNGKTKMKKKRRLEKKEKKRNKNY